MAQTNTADTPFGDYTSDGPFSASQLTGGTQVDYSLGQGHDLTSSSLAADVKPIVSVEATYVGGSGSAVPTPDSVKVDLTFERGYCLDVVFQ